MPRQNSITRPGHFEVGIDVDRHVVGPSMKGHDAAPSRKSAGAALQPPGRRGVGRIRVEHGLGRQWSWANDRDWQRSWCCRERCGVVIVDDVLILRVIVQGWAPSPIA